MLHAYIYEHSQRLIDDYPVYEVQAISRIQSQCENMIFVDQSRYNILFKRVIPKGGEPKISYI